jgi:Type II restriction enzyme SfiI
MNQDYRDLTSDEHELVEKQTLRTIVQALQQYSREARDIFETTRAISESEVIVLAEDLVQYALEVAEIYPIDKRFAGFIDYKRVRWLPTPFGLLPQVLLVDAKASTENTRDTLQQSQLPMNAEFLNRGAVVTLQAGVPPHLDIISNNGSALNAVTTSIFTHFYYQNISPGEGRYRTLKAMYVLSIPHARLKDRYNPSPQTTFFGAGKHSPARGEEPRIRVYFSPLRQACPWRLQELAYEDASGFSTPRWRDVDPETGLEISELFRFLPR